MDSEGIATFTSTASMVDDSPSAAFAPVALGFAADLLFMKSSPPRAAPSPITTTAAAMPPMAPPERASVLWSAEASMMLPVPVGGGGEGEGDPGGNPGVNVAH